MLEITPKALIVPHQVTVDNNPWQTITIRNVTDRRLLELAVEAPAFIQIVFVQDTDSLTNLPLQQTVGHFSSPIPLAAGLVTKIQWRILFGSNWKEISRQATLLKIGKINLFLNGRLHDSLPIQVEIPKPQPLQVRLHPETVDFGVHRLSVGRQVEYLERPITISNYGDTPLIVQAELPSVVEIVRGSLKVTEKGSITVPGSSCVTYQLRWKPSMAGQLDTKIRYHITRNSETHSTAALEQDFYIPILGFIETDEPLHLFHPRKGNVRQLDHDFGHVYYTERLNYRFILKNSSLSSLRWVSGH
jgi:hypothetical protein